MRLDKGKPLTPGEGELLALFRAMAESDRRLLLSTAEKLFSAGAGSEGRTP